MIEGVGARPKATKIPPKTHYRVIRRDPYDLSTYVVDVIAHQLIIGDEYPALLFSDVVSADDNEMRLRIVRVIHGYEDVYNLGAASQIN